jgi:hypothetical protein
MTRFPFKVKKRRGLAIELIWFILTLIAVSLLFVGGSVLISAVFDVGLANGVNSGTLDFLSLIWNNTPAIVIVVGILFVVVAAIRRDTGYETMS